MWKVTDIRPDKDYGGDIVVEFTNPTEPLDRRRRTRSFISETDAREGIPAHCGGWRTSRKSTATRSRCASD